MSKLKAILSILCGRPTFYGLKHQNFIWQSEETPIFVKCSFVNCDFELKEPEDAVEFRPTAEDNDVVGRHTIYNAARMAAEDIRSNPNPEGLFK